MIKKNILFLLFVINSSLLVGSVYAATLTPTPEDKTAKIDQLITNIASHVAQLDLVEKRGIIGKVTDVANTQITLTDSQDNTRFVDVDELTNFSDPSANEAFGISDITSDMTVGILGLYNKESRRILARFVNVITVPTIIHGGVTAINNEDFSLDIATEEGKQIIVDVENLTRTYSYTQEDDYIKSGFSKIKENFNIIVIGFMNKNEEGRLTSTRIIFFPEIPPNPKVNSAVEKTQESK